jgi:signal transduction histidine kinase/ligand-binding sensor domain-containing protein
MENAQRSRTAFALGVLLAFGPCTLALDPSLDVSQYAHRSWKVSEGFCKGTIHAIAQTPDGYLWLATEFGLLRFDGVRAVPWQPPAGEHLPSTDIRNLIVASDGTLWLGTAKGLVSWKNGILHHYPQFDKHDVSSLLQDREGTVWAAGTIWESGPSQTGNTALCAIKGAGLQCYGQDGSFGGYGVTSIYEDSRGNLWLGAGNGVWRWKPGPPKHYPFPELKQNGMAGLLFVRKAFLEAEDGAIFIAISGVEGVYRLANGKLEHYRVASIKPHFYDGGGLVRDRDGGVWVGTAGGGLLHVHHGRIDAFNQADGLSGDTVESIFEDREGSIWVGTRAGLDSFHEYAIPTVSVKQGLSSGFVRSVLATEDGSVWMATPNGLNRWKDGQVAIYRKPPAGAGDQRNGGAAGAGQREQGTNRSPDIRPRAPVEIPAPGLPDNGVGSLYSEAPGRLWVSTAKGLAYFENGKFTPLPQLHIPSWSLSPVARDNSGNLWITSDQGLYRLSGGKVAEFLPTEKLGLHGLIATLLATDPMRGGMWIGSWEGGVVYFKDGKVRASFGPGTGLGAGRVNDLQMDRENTLWVATDGGLSRVTDRRAVTLTGGNGLPCDTALGVKEDDEHSLWVYMACGLVRIARPELQAWVADPQRRIKVTVFDNSDGVMSHAGVYNFAPRMTKARDGRLWFVPLDGVSIIDPRHLAFNHTPPPVHIERIVADDRNYEVANGINLPAPVRNLAIDYTALSLIAPEKVRFRYKLENQDRDWREVINDRQVQYSNLAPGKYRFRVIACNNSGVWNETGDSLDFDIPPAWYQTSWFLAACVAAFLLMIWGIHVLRVRQLEAQFNLRAEERAIERIRIARELHDTLLQSFQGLLLRFQVASNQLSAGKEEAKESLDRAIDDAAQAITEGRDAIQGLRASTAETNDLPVAIRTVGEELAADESNPAPAGFQVQVAGRPRSLPPVLRDEVYRLAAEALRNAFRHAQARRIEVEIRYDEKQFGVRVRDDGKGIDPQVLGQGGRSRHYGLHGMRERARLVGGRLEVWSALGAGTEVELTIPASIAYETSPTGLRSWLSERLSWNRTARKP